ncbi:MAG: hypothetical protein QOI09_1285, partial [Chloroflexota bacterium]|nr:hypothetical protein [Chloroflexota bacterium]
AAHHAVPTARVVLAEDDDSGVVHDKRNDLAWGVPSVAAPVGRRL